MGGLFLWVFEHGENETVLNKKILYIPGNE